MMEVHPKVQKKLRRLFRKYRERGLDLFLFGSIAESWPESRRGADLDIGYDSRQLSSNRTAIERELERDIDALPTVRPVDLVDFGTASPDFRKEALKSIRERI
jgi:hypothetical protein